MTIADKMRQMTDEELARILEIFDNSLAICDAAGRNCIFDIENNPTCEGCPGYLKWLQQEVVE